MSVNRVILIGNIGRDPEIRYLPSGDSVANAALATSEGNSDVDKVASQIASYFGLDKSATE